MFALMLIDTPDDRYRGGRPERSWRRVLRLLAGAVACFLPRAPPLPWVGLLLALPALLLLLLPRRRAPAAVDRLPARHRRRRPRPARALRARRLTAQPLPAVTSSQSDGPPSSHRAPRA